jgi:transcriptional regulator with XRE-family HTH domain
MDLRVKKICKEKGITVTQLAERLNINKVSLSKAINGNPTIGTCERIAAVLDIPFIELFEAKSENCSNICAKCGMKIVEVAEVKQSPPPPQEKQMPDTCLLEYLNGFIEENRNIYFDLLRSIRSMEPAWAKVSQSKFALANYLDEQGKIRPMYELTKRECLYIATKFNDEARAKLVIRWEELETKAQKMPAIASEYEKRIATLEGKLNVLEAHAGMSPDMFTIAGYAKLSSFYLTPERANQLGRAASKVCRERSVTTGTIPDSRYGYVKCYPREVLKEVFSDCLL